MITLKKTHKEELDIPPKHLEKLRKYEEADKSQRKLKQEYMR